MSRLQKKCLVFSAAMHVLLIVVMAFSSAFSPKKKPKVKSHRMHLVSSSMISKLLASTPPQELSPAPPVVAQPEPSPKKTVTPEPVPEKPKPLSEKPKPARKKPEPKKQSPPPNKPVVEVPKNKVQRSTAKKAEPSKQKKPEIKVNLDPTKREITPDIRRQVQTGVQANRRQRDAVRQAAKRLDSSLSGKTAVSLPKANGSRFLNYGLFVKRAYDQAWMTPRGVKDRRATVRVVVVVAPDGKISSATIQKRSGVSVLDGSVKDAIKRVVKIRSKPPEGASEGERTFILDFTLEEQYLEG